jgi:ribosomal protein L11 methyltransferase
VSGPARRCRVRVDRAPVIRLAVRAPAADAERVLAAVLELAPQGVEQVDGDGFVEFALYGAPGELPSLGEGEAAVAGVAVSVHGSEVPDDWAERWRRFHRPILVGACLYVRPPWEEPAVQPGVEEVVIDPGQAFGTGTHPTTEACLELLVELAPPRRGLTALARRWRRRSARPGTGSPGPPGSLADLGCGSGVLAIAAARLGFEPVVAVDADREAVDATRRNARANGVELASVQRVDLRAEAPPAADVVAANLMRPLLMRLAPRLVERPTRAAIVSGLLEEEAGEVAAAFAPGLEEVRRITRRGWSTLLLERTPY